MKKEGYNKPEIRSEAIEIGAYGNYNGGPIQALQPFFGICCGGGAGGGKGE